MNHVSSRLATALIGLLLLTLASAQGVLRLATNADPTLNPWSPNARVESRSINLLLFDGLLRYDEENLALAPSLAESWEVSDDGLTWTFRLRPGLLWSDGEVLDAEDVAYTFNDIVLSDDLAAEAASRYALVQEVAIIDPLTVEFRLAEPLRSLGYFLAGSAILPQHVLSRFANPLIEPAFNRDNPVGSGAFVLDEYVSGSHLRLVPNPNSWREPARLEAIDIAIIPDPNTQVAQLLANQLDFLRLDNPALLAGVERNPALRVVRQNTNTWYALTLNLNLPKFEETAVRQALLTAVDRQAIIDSVLDGYGVPAFGPIAPVQAAVYNADVARHSFDAERALELFALAGYEPDDAGVLRRDGEPFQVTLRAGQFSFIINAALLVQQYWEAIGVQVNFESLEWNTFIQTAIVGGDFEAVLVWWSTPLTTDVSAQFSSTAADGGGNLAHYRNSDLDELLVAARRATTDEEEYEAVQLIQEFIAQELPYLFLFHPETILVLNEGVQGISELDLTAAFQHSDAWYIGE